MLAEQEVMLFEFLLTVFDVFSYRNAPSKLHALIQIGATDPMQRDATRCNIGARSIRKKKESEAAAKWGALMNFLIKSERHRATSRAIIISPID